MKYFVIAIKWDEEKEAQVKYVAGQFNSYINAELFRNAYNDHYSANAQIYSEYELLNKEMNKG